MSKIRLHGSSSGYTEIAPVAASGNNTLTLPNDGTIISQDSNGAVGVTSITVGTGVTIGDGRVTCTTLHGSAANCTQIPAANIVGVCTSGFSRTGGFGGITFADSWRVSSSFSVGSGQNTITSNWERDDFNFEKIGDGLTQSSGIFTFPETGKYLLLWNHSAYSSSAHRYVGVLALLSTDTGGSYSTIGETYDSIFDAGNSAFGAGAMTIIVDVTNASTFKLKWNTSTSGTVAYDANSNQQRTGFTCIKLGDT